MREVTMYTVIGNHSVAGVAPGEVLTAEQLGDANIGVLVQAGHIAPVVAKKAVKAASAEADEADQSKED
jgi:hypothetical protein